MLEVKNLHYSYGSKPLLRKVAMEVASNAIVGLLGLNGSGKSTLMQLIFGSIKPPKNVVLFDGKNYTSAFKEQGLVQYLPQFNFVPKQLTVAQAIEIQNVAFGKVADLFPELADYQTCKLSQLSGGMRRLVEVTSIIMSRAKYLLLDEPFSQIEPKFIERLSALIVQEKAHKAILLSDHLYYHITALADRLLVLTNGAVFTANNEQDLVLLGYTKR